jgi:hypothetical protein
MDDSLSKKLEVQSKNGDLLGIKIVRGTKRLNHSQFVDYTIFLGGSSIITTNRFNMSLNSFLLSSSEEVN